MLGYRFFGGKVVFPVKRLTFQQYYAMQKTCLACRQMGLFFIGEMILAFTEEEVARCEEAVNRLGSQVLAAKELGMSRSALQRRLYSASGERVIDSFLEENADQVGFSPENTKAYWAKTDKGSFYVRMPENSVDIVSEVKAALAEGIPVAKPNSILPQTNEDLLNCFVIADYHLAMMAWSEETRKADWDLKIAEELLMKWFGAAIEAAPKAKSAMFAQMGDWTHWDSMNTITPAHGHLLDGDSRSQKMIRVAIRVTRMIIDMLLAKHEIVYFYNLSGNHDEFSGAFSREMWHMHYDPEPRVIVDNTPDLYHAHEHGDVSLFLHHGHKRDLNNIDHVFASRFREIYGRTKFSYGHTGHKHSHVIKETNLMKIEQHPTLAPEDAYASFGGWSHKREASRITYHRKFGEVSRSTISPEMLY